MFAKKKRKKAVCNTELKFNESHIVKVNGMSVKDYFHNELDEKDLEKIFIDSSFTIENFSIISFVSGGGKKAQYTSFIQSIAKGVLNFLKAKYSEEEYIKVKKIMRNNDLVTSDHRQKQSKTPGKVKARKTRQFSKR